jgi:hypothetical protein
MRAALILAVAAGCATSAGDHASNPDGSGSGVPTFCSASVTVAQTGQPAPLAGPDAAMRITAQVAGGDGVLDYAWTVQFAGAASPFTRIDDGSAIDVPVPVPGVYLVTLQVSGASNPCAPAVATVNVGVAGALIARYRVRVVPPRSVAAPEMEQSFDIAGGADADLGPIRVDSGSLEHPTVMAPDGPSPA